MHLYQIRKLNSESDKLISLVFKEFLVYVSQEKYIEFFSLKEAALSLQMHISLADSTDSIAQKMINLNIANACLSDFKKHLVGCVDMGYIREPQLSHFFNCLDCIVELLGIYRRASKQNLIKWDVQFDSKANSIELHKKDKLYSSNTQQLKQAEKFLGAAEKIVLPKLFKSQNPSFLKKPASYSVPPIRDYIDNLVNKWNDERANSKNSSGRASNISATNTSNRNKSGKKTEDGADAVNQQFDGPTE